jgi:hypothetical protein
MDDDIENRLDVIEKVLAMFVVSFPVKHSTIAKSDNNVMKFIDWCFRYVKDVKIT